MIWQMKLLKSLNKTLKYFLHAESFHSLYFANQ